MKIRFVLLAAIGCSVIIGSWIAAEVPKSVEEPFHKDLLQIAAEYKTWGRVDDEMRWSPTDCRTPNPGQPRLSASKDEATHGKKLYSLLTKQRNAYLALAKENSVPVGFSIVKQSWIPEEITDSKLKPPQGLGRFDFKQIIHTPAKKDGKDDKREWLGDHFYPFVWKDGKVFKATKQADLFVMMKLDPKTPGTDNGWVYATIAPDGKNVTSAGKIESCMKCHQGATSDRLFGLAR